MVILTCHYFDKYLNCFDIVRRPNNVLLLWSYPLTDTRICQIDDNRNFLRMCCCYWYPSFKNNLFYNISSGTLRFYNIIVPRGLERIVIKMIILIPLFFSGYDLEVFTRTVGFVL